MKRIILLGLIVFGIVAVKLLVFPKIETTLLPSPLVSPSPTVFSNSLFGLVTNEEALTNFVVENQTYRLAWIEITEPDKTSLGINAELKNESNEIKQINGCTTITNGGFYQENGDPIGWLVTAYQQISDWENNQLFNGFVGVLDKQFVISKNAPTQSGYAWAIQAGPVLISNSKPMELQLQRDQPARRLVAGISKSGSLILLMIMSKDSLFSGPNLADMPRVLQGAQTVIGAEWESAINLDGGTASTFQSEKVSLKELKPIGSFLCVK